VFVISWARRSSTFVPYKSDQRFCSAYHRVKYCAENKRKQALYNASMENNEELERLRDDNERYKNENDRLNDQLENLKESIKKYNDRIDRLEEIIDKRDGALKQRNEELERLRKEKKVLMNRPATNLTRKHLQSVLNSEIRRQFPNDVDVQAHIVAIRSFNASSINALATS
jgi:peptidoglycan hydrolase CwlO-like protein